MFKASWLIEKRSGNARLMWLMPLCFSGFAFLWQGAAGRSDMTHSIYATVSLNLDTLIFLPITCALLVNSTAKRQKQLQLFFTSNGVGQRYVILNQLIINACQLAVILILEAILGTIIIYGTNDVYTLSLGQYWLSIGCVYLCTLPILGISAVLSQIGTPIMTLLVNFCFGIAGALVAVKNSWWSFPWSYSMRAVATLLDVHPNGTIVQPNSAFYLAVQSHHTLITVLGFSLGVFLICLGLHQKIGGRNDVTIH